MAGFYGVMVALPAAILALAVALARFDRERPGRTGGRGGGQR